VFKEVIEEMIHRVEGARSILIIGMDGIIIDRAYRLEPVDDDLNYDLVAAEYTSLLKTAIRTAEDVEIGGLQELNVFTERYNFLLKMITEDYFVMVILDLGGNFGRGRYEIRKAKILLEKEFQI
jgi:predicted regulator of Ras-like GTPase activity (Roadblock/LC7/MglB family)